MDILDFLKVLTTYRDSLEPAARIAFDSRLLDTSEIDRQEAELFEGKTDSELSEEEMLVIYESPELSHAEQFARLKVIRAGRQVTPRTFSERMTTAGNFHAAGMGIRL